MNEDFKQVLMIGIIGVLAASSAYHGRWDLVTTCITGYFALLNVSRRKEGASENTTNVSNPNP